MRVSAAVVHGRFIPARAGNTPATSARTTAATVHPRSRGEHSGITPACSSSSGSSPLARGTLRPLDPVGGSDRFIPARAGNTGPRRRDSWRPPVHPRSRGEHALNFRLSGVSAGSSPLARGTPCCSLWARWRKRFIPARAGNTSWLPPPSPIEPVHPRSRGEHTSTSRTRPYVSGSSPLARGTLDRATPRLGALRFIPARAGNTYRTCR